MHIEKLHKALRIATPIVDKIVDSDDSPFRNPWIATGGFLRDVLLGLPPKDLDVAVDDPFVHTSVLWSAGSERDYEHGYIKSVGTCTDALPMPIEFIHRSTGAYVENLVEYHACGLSNVFWNRHQLVFDNTFLEDVGDKVVRASRKCARAHNESDAINEYLTRIHKKLEPLGFTLELMR